MYTSYLTFLNKTLKDKTQEEFNLFGIHFIEDVKDDLTKEEFNTLFRGSEIKNLDEFYSLYAFDFYLDNSDRHIKNILILNGLNIAYLIDHDKIFAQRTLKDDGIHIIDKTLFKCVKNHANQYLYDIIETEKQYKDVVVYANKISDIPNDIIKHELDQNYYELAPDILEIIKEYFIYRKQHILTECQKFKERCYEKLN